MKIGLLAYSTNTGLGYQTLEFYEHMRPDKVLLVDLKQLNGVETHHERYFQPYVFEASKYELLSNEACEWLVDGMDVVFVCETPLNYHLYEYARKKGVKTVQQYNYEFLDYFRKTALPVPDVLASPSMWGIERVKAMNLAKVDHWPVPVDTTIISFRERSEVKTLVHIIGRPAAQDRNGTLTFLKMAEKLGDGYNFKVFLQQPNEQRAVEHFKPVQKELLAVQYRLWGRFEIIEDTLDKKDMYKWGDILVLPRRYGGLCLPMWEALSAGMPVIMPNISPNNYILPQMWLVEASIKGSFQAHTNIPIYDVDVDDLVAKIEKLKGGFKDMSKYARRIAEGMSWEAQKPIYEDKLKRLCE